MCLERPSFNTDRPCGLIFDKVTSEVFFSNLTLICKCILDDISPPYRVASHMILTHSYVMTKIIWSENIYSVSDAHVSLFIHQKLRGARVPRLVEILKFEEDTMATYVFSDQPLNNSLVGSISSLLSAAGVPNLLWGNYLLTVYGVPTIVDVSVVSLYALSIERLLIRCQGVSFVVPDALLEAGRSTLSFAGFLSCTQGPKCPYPNAASCLATATHLHINDELVISLHRKSDVLWDFPDLGIGANSTDIMSAADTRLPPARLGRGQGRFPPYLSGVRIPSAVRYCEAIIYLLCRDHESPREAYWMAILTYLLEYVDETDFFQENWLREGYRQFYRAMKQGDPEMYLHLKTLRDVFIKSSV